LKPENVLVDLDGHIKLTDFGLCRLDFTDQDLSTSLCGSPEYMCPEMLEAGTHSISLDYYQVGAFLFELVTGLPPCFSKDKKEMLLDIINK
jgi:serine/threonine protein kinase